MPFNTNLPAENTNPWYNPLVAAWTSLQTFVNGLETGVAGANAAADDAAAVASDALEAVADLPNGYIQFVTVTTGLEPRPTGPLVFWIDVTRSVDADDPVNMLDNDIRVRSGSAQPAIAPTITTTALDTIIQNVAFSQILNASGTSPKTWTLVAGTLPTGLTLQTNGVLSGTPTVSGAYNFTVRATNIVGQDDQVYSGNIAGGTTAPTITITELNTITEEQSFSQQITATGSTPMVWGITAGTIPGLTINSSTGVLSGTPTAAGPYSITIQADNTAIGGGTDSQVFSGTVQVGSGAVEYTIFGTTVPGALSTFTDADPNSWTSHQFYVPSTGASLIDWQIARARLYVPAGSAHIGQTWRAALVRRPDNTLYTGATGFPQVGEYSTNGTLAEGALLIAGWNEVAFAGGPYPGVGNLRGWVVGVQIGNGTRYFHNTTVDPNAIPALGGANFYLSELNVGDAPNRPFYNASTSTAHWYGIDVVVVDPG